MSVTDLTKSTDTLLRSHKKDQVIWEESNPTSTTNNNHGSSQDKPAKPTPSISSRSQSLNEIGKSKKVVTQHQDIGSQGRSRSTNTILATGQSSSSSSSSSSTRKGSMGNTIEQRRRSTMSKLKGLVIPEMVSETSTVNHSSSEEKVEENGKLSGSGSTSNKQSSSSLPNPPWKDKTLTEDFPKYSPAFKRKPFTVYGNSNRKEDGEQSSQNSRSQPVYKPPIGKKNSDEGSTVLKTEDSDNDSAVSSGRSSLSCRSCTPPHSPKSSTREKSLNNKNSQNSELNPRILKKNSVEAINRQNVINACKKSSATDLGNKNQTEPPLDTSSPRSSRTCSKPASRSSSFTIAERKKSFESHHSSESSSSTSRRGSNSSHDSVSRKSSRDICESNMNSSRISSRETLEAEMSSRRSSRVTTPTGSMNYPESIMDIEEKVAFMTEVVDRASSATPTERRSLSRTPSIASERSSYSSRSSRNSSIVSEKAPFARNSSIMSKDSAISEDITKELEEKSPTSDKKWSDLEKKYSRGLSSGSIGETISKLSKSSEEGKNERPKELMIAQKKITNGINSPSSKNFKELAEKWQTMSVPDTPVTPVNNASMVATLPRKSSKEKIAKEDEIAGKVPDIATLPRRTSREKSPVRSNIEKEPILRSNSQSSWSPSPPAAVKG